MGIGLGKNSPIVLSQNRANFESLIQRHGQWVRWRTAKKCPCVRNDTGQPEVRCDKCGGSGDIYDCQKSYKAVFQAKVRDGVFMVPNEYSDCEILKVYDPKDGNEFTFTQIENFVEITGKTRDVKQGDVLECLFSHSIVRRIERVALEKIGGGVYRVPGVETALRKLDGVYYRAPGDVLTVEKAETAEGEAVSVLGFRQNTIQVDSDADDLTVYGVEYILPFKFIVLSQELTKADAALVDAHNGAAVCTFPYMYDVAENDVITVLSGTMTAKAVITKKEGDDTIPEFFVSAVKNLETVGGAYKEGADFILTGTNRIHWLENMPEAGMAMSLVYQYYPTYRVAKNIPNLRTSEDQRIPRKVVLKLFGAFAESRRVNQNG